MYLCDSNFKTPFFVKNKTLIIFALAFVGMLCIFLSASTVENPGTNKSKAELSEDIHIEIPRKLTFAGEVVPLENFDVRESLERELISNSYFHSQTIYLLKRLDRYMAVIEPILAQYNIPEDFKFLAVAESILYDKAKSPVGASGIWQLMKGTAQDYGLEVNDNVDERYNLLLSTHAACQFLLESYEKYNNWTLVAASYNMGRRALDRSMAYCKQDNYYNMYLNAETARYVYRILAFKLLIESPENYGFAVAEEDKFPVFNLDTVLVDYPIEHIADFAVEQGMTYKTLKLFNPWLIENHLNNASKKKYKVLVAKKGYRTKK